MELGDECVSSSGSDGTQWVCSSKNLPQLPRDNQFIDEENEGQRLGDMPKDLTS